MKAITMLMRPGLGGDLPCDEARDWSRLGGIEGDGTFYSH